MLNPTQTEPRYPILVAWSDFKGETSSLLGCNGCGRTVAAPEDVIGRIENLGTCACGHWYEWAYDPADECAGCGTLGFFLEVNRGCCSRVCMLQAEYKRELEARKAAEDGTDHADYHSAFWENYEHRCRFDYLAPSPTERTEDA